MLLWRHGEVAVELVQSTVLLLCLALEARPQLLFRRQSPTIKVLRTLFLVDLEPVDFGFVLVDFWREHGRLFVALQKQVGKGRSEVSAVDVNVPVLGQVHLLTLRAEYLEKTRRNKTRFAN